MTLSGEVRTLLVDTGAELSILRKAVAGVAVIPLRVDAKGVTGARLSVTGTQELECCVGHHKVLHTFIIADIETWRDGLLGWDLLHKLGAVVDVANQGVTFRSGSLEISQLVDVLSDRGTLHPRDNALQGRGSQQPIRPQKSPEVTSGCEKNYRRAKERVRNILVQAGATVTIPAYSEQMIEARTDAATEEEVVVEPIEQPQAGLRVARSLSRPQDQRIWIKVANLSARPLPVQRRQILGLAEPMPEMDLEEVNLDCNGLTQAVVGEKLKHLDREEAEVIEKVLWRYSSVFEAPGKEGCRSSVQHRIPTGDNRPITKRPYRVPHHLRPVVEEHLAEMLDKGVIVPSSSPWSAPVVLVPKKTSDGSLKYRFCTDFRALNTITKADAYPLPLIQETLEHLGQSRYYSTLDLVCGYHQIPISPEDQEKTAFTTVGGHFEYRRMAFGLSGAPATFQRYMDNLLAAIKGPECLVYLDDVIIFSGTIAEHAVRLGNVLACFERANLKVNLKKCRFAQSSVEYLGHIVTEDGVKPDQKKIEAIQKFPQPNNVRDVRGFLGLAGYYRRFIGGFAEIAKPLTTLTKKDVEFQWGQEQETAFSNLKTALCSESVLAYPDFAKPFILATDASGTALGAVLSQIHDDKERPVAYASRQMNAAERNYATTERELLAVVWAVKQFRCYLLGRSFKLITDHAALRWMLSLRDPSSRLTRWALQLAEFDYVVEHKPGKRHTNADALSRAKIDVVTKCGEASSRAKIADTNQVIQPGRSDTSIEEEILTAQQEDETCQRLRRGTLKGRVRIRKELLYWRDGQFSKGGWKLVVPKLLQRKIMDSCHATPWAGHPGVARTIARIRQRYYWPRMREDVEVYVRECVSCAKRKGPVSNTVPLQLFKEPVRPYEMISLDVVGPLPITRAGNKYLLTCMDYLTRYVEAIPVPNQTAETTAQAFVNHVITRHGTPERVLTDQGANFMSDLFRATCHLLKIKQLRTTAYHPQCNGRIERFHRTFFDSLSHFVNRDGRDWDRWVPFVRMAYNSSVNTSTGYSPFYLIFGREMTTPDKWEVAECAGSGDIEDHMLCLRQRLSEAHEEARKRTSAAAARRATASSEDRPMREFKAGDTAYLLDTATKPGLSKKFAQPWKGPYRITERMSPVNYRLDLGRDKSLVVHVNRLKPAHGFTPLREGGYRSPVSPMRSRTEEDMSEGSNSESEANGWRAWSSEEEDSPLAPTTVEPSEGEISSEPEDLPVLQYEDELEAVSSPPGPRDDPRQDPLYRPTLAGRQPRSRSPYLLRSRARTTAER